MSRMWKPLYMCWRSKLAEHHPSFSKGYISLMLTPHLSLKALRPRGPPLANCPLRGGQQVAPGLHRPDPKRLARLRRPKSPRKGARFPDAAAPLGRRSKGANGPQLLPTVRARPTPRFPRKTREPSRGGPLARGTPRSGSDTVSVRADRGRGTEPGICAPRPPRRKGRGWAATWPGASPPRRSQVQPHAGWPVVPGAGGAEDGWTDGRVQS